MSKKEVCITAYNLITGLQDVHDENFVSTIIDAIMNGEEYVVEEILREIEVEED